MTEKVAISSLPAARTLIGSLTAVQNLAVQLAGLLAADPYFLNHQSSVFVGALVDAAAAARQAIEQQLANGTLLSAGSLLRTPERSGPAPLLGPPTDPTITSNPEYSEIKVQRIENSGRSADLQRQRLLSERAVLSHEEAGQAHERQQPHPGVL